MHAKAQVHGYQLKGESGEGKVCSCERFWVDFGKSSFLVDYAISNSRHLIFHNIFIISECPERDSVVRWHDADFIIFGPVGGLL